MSYGGEYITIPGLTAGADLSSSQYCTVKMASTAGQVIICAAATDVPVGVLQNKPTSGQAAEVATLGVVKAKLGASVALTKPLLYPNTTGYLQGTTVPSKSTIGTAFEISSATAGEIHPIILGR